MTELFLCNKALFCLERKLNYKDITVKLYLTYLLLRTHQPHIRIRKVLLKMMVHQR